MTAGVSSSVEFLSLPSTFLLLILGMLYRWNSFLIVVPLKLMFLVAVLLV